MQRMVWTELDKHESMVHVERQARYVEGVYAAMSCCRPSVCGAGMDLDKPKLF